MYLYGASGHGKVIAEILEEIGIEVSAFIDDDDSITSILGKKVIRFDNTLIENSQTIISIGSNRLRKQIADKLRTVFITAIHPKAVVSKTCSIDAGTVVMANATINSSVNIGKHCIINTSASVDHDCQIGDFVHISPNATLSGNVSVGEGTWIGAGATIINGINIGKWCIIGAGAIIIKDVPDGATVVGNPGKIIKIAEL